MNRGAFIFEKNLFTEDELKSIKKLANDLYKDKTSVHDNGSYENLQWYQVHLNSEFNFVKKLFKALQIDFAELCVFYYLEPEAKLHPHRDLTGASLNNRIRFHIPIITNPKLEFYVDNERVVMNEGDLWCLDTSYLHSVYNGGENCRVHLIVECNINDFQRKKIPHDYKAKLHSLSYAFLLCVKFMKAIFINVFINPKHFKQQISMVVRFIKWRVFKIGNAK
jgi:Aspartyl/Asparaginyl beta-hydroxylase